MDANTGAGEGYASRSALFPRRDDVTMDLRCLFSESDDNGRKDACSDLCGYQNMDIVTSPSLARDGRSLLVVVRVEKGRDAEGTRAYVLRVGLAPLPGGGGDGGVNDRVTPVRRQGRSPYVPDVAWLDRYSGRSVASVGGTLECFRLVAADEADKEDAALAGGVGGAVAYVILHVQWKYSMVFTLL